MFFHSFIAMEYAFTLFFFTVNSSINAAGDHLAGGSFMEKALNYWLGVIAWSRWRRVRVLPNSLFPSFFFFPFFVLLFSINI